jgi:NAD(P)-dependent dehydrogenase (short-subunit alcohol dehydrogenase family)
VNITSSGGKVAIPLLGAYSASKSGLEGMSDALLAADPIAQKAGVPLIASLNTALGITDMGAIFRTSPPDEVGPCVTQEGARR